MTTKLTAVTANSHGIVVYKSNGKSYFERYDKDNVKNNVISFKSKFNNFNDKIELNVIQRQMFRRLMYGLEKYSPEEIAALSPASISRIISDFKKAKQALHILKAKKYYHAETVLLNSIFPQARITDRDCDWFVDLPKNVTLTYLKISTTEVINEFIRRKLLPHNFFKLTPETIKL